MKRKFILKLKNSKWNNWFWKCLNLKCSEVIARSWVRHLLFKMYNWKFLMQTAWILNSKWKKVKNIKFKLTLKIFSHQPARTEYKNLLILYHTNILYSEYSLISKTVKLAETLTKLKYWPMQQYQQLTRRLHKSKLHQKIKFPD